MFTGDEYADGGEYIAQALSDAKIRASFFFTGRFYRNAAFKPVIRKLKADGHYLGAHSDQHLLYCDWSKRDSLLVSQKQFTDDLLRNYAAMKTFGIEKKEAPCFLPPYEWYNDTIATWTKALGLQLINFTPGTRSNADYTTPGMKNYVSSEEIFQSIVDYESKWGLNGFILLLHVGTDPARTDKFYHKLPSLLQELRNRGYEFLRIDQLAGK